MTPQCKCNEDKERTGIYGQFLSSHAMNCPLFTQPKPLDAKPETQKESWEEELELMLGIAPEGTLKHDRQEQIKKLIRKALTTERARVVEELEKAKEILERPQDFTHSCSYCYYPTGDCRCDSNSGLETAISIIKESR